MGNVQNNDWVEVWAEERGWFNKKTFLGYYKKSELESQIKTQIKNLEKHHKFSIFGEKFPDHLQSDSDTESTDAKNTDAHKTNDVIEENDSQDGAFETAKSSVSKDSQQLVDDNTFHLICLGSGRKKTEDKSMLVNLGKHLGPQAHIIDGPSANLGRNFDDNIKTGFEEIVRYIEKNEKLDKNKAITLNLIGHSRGACQTVAIYNKTIAYLQKNHPNLIIHFELFLMDPVRGPFTRFYDTHAEETKWIFPPHNPKSKTHVNFVFASVNMFIQSTKAMDTSYVQVLDPEEVTFKVTRVNDYHGSLDHDRYKRPGSGIVAGLLEARISGAKGFYDREVKLKYNKDSEKYIDPKEIPALKKRATKKRRQVEKTYSPSPKKKHHQSGASDRRLGSSFVFPLNISSLDPLFFSP